MKRRAALAIAEGVAKGVPALETTVDSLCNVLSEPGQDRMVRLSVARALVALDARSAATVLVQATDPNDLEMAEVVEPALARWGETGLRDRWLERLNGEVRLRRFHVLAIRGLVALEQKDVLPRLLELALDRHTPASVRLEAANALGSLQESGLTDAARELCEDQSFAAVVDRLAAAKMLASHRGKKAESFLVQTATDPEPAVRAVALHHLFQIDPSLILPIIEKTVLSKDANVRRWGAETLVSKAAPGLLEVLVPMLDDQDPELRRFVCDSLVALADDSALRDGILREARNVLNADGWRGQEQATLLLVTLKDTTITDRLLELLDVSRPEAHVAAAWGLCQFALPETVEPVHKILCKKTESCLAHEPQNEGIGDQLALLAQLLGVLKCTPADAVLRKYVPKGALTSTSRSAAIWALGKLHSGEPDPELVRLLEGRVLDAFSLNPESVDVCRMSAITLGRMNAQSAIKTLQIARSQTTLDTGFGYACAWALNQLTGEEIPPLKPTINLEQDWFLIPTQRP